MKVLNFGSCNIDYVYSVDHIVVPGETTASYELELFCGGKGLNQSIAAAKAGAEVFHAGCIGNDGQILRNTLSENGVDVSNLRTVNAKNGHAIIQVNKNGENSILLYSGSNEMITEEYIDEVLEKFSPEDILLLQNEISNIGYIIKKAYSKGISVVLNPAPFDEKIKTIDFKMLSFVILNEVEAKGLTGKEQPEEIVRYMRENYPELRMVLTLGKKGCIYADKNQTLYHPAFEVDAIDTTAAGDTFIGYFLASISKQKTYYDAIKIASAASALAVSKKGASPSIPFEEEVEKALGFLKPYNVDRTEYVREQINCFFDKSIKTARLSDLAKELNYSENYTGELIKRITDKTFSQILQEKRCALAAKLLRETELPIEEIISKTGYQNKSFFRQKFQEMYKQTPYQYRKTINK